MFTTSYSQTQGAVLQAQEVGSRSVSKEVSNRRTLPTFPPSFMSMVRERHRTRTLNDAFSELRRIIPSLPSDKMSKIKTLQLAISYIEFLDTVLQFSPIEDVNCNQVCFDDYCVDSSSQNTIGVDLSQAFQLWRMNGASRSSNSSGSK